MKTFDPPLPFVWERDRVRGIGGLATLIAPSPKPSPIQGEGEEMSVTVAAKRITNFLPGKEQRWP
jgi:hypothetical protein